MPTVENYFKPNGDFRFFQTGQVCDKLWKSIKSQFHWIVVAGTVFNCFF